MTQYAKQLTFSFYHDRLLVADFKGGQITSDAGLLPVGGLGSQRTIQRTESRSPHGSGFSFGRRCAQEARDLDTPNLWGRRG